MSVKVRVLTVSTQLTEGHSEGHSEGGGHSEGHSEGHRFRHYLNLLVAKYADHKSNATYYE